MNDFVIETKQLTKIYGNQTAVDKVNLHVKKRSNLWSVGTQWSWKNHNYENDFRVGFNHVWRGRCIRREY